jgi:TPR repeat protein
LAFCTLSEANDGLPADLESAKAAFARGEFDVSAPQFRYLAQEGVAEAQCDLGSSYYIGAGVEKD